MGSAAKGRRPLESADPRGPACGSMEGERKRGYLNQKLPTGGRGPLHTMGKPLSIGLAFGFQNLSSRVSEREIFQIDGFRQPRVAQMGFRHLFRRSPELSGEGF